MDEMWYQLLIASSLLLAVGASVWGLALTKTLKKAALERDEATKQLAATNQKIAEIQEQVDSLTKLAAVGEMSTSMAEEFNNPLAVVKAASETIELKLDMEGELPNYEGDFFLINKNIKRIVGIIDGFKALAGSDDDLEDGKKKAKFNATELTRNVLSRFSKLDIDFDIQIQSELHVTGNSAHFEQILISLLNNAVDAVDDQRKKQIAVHLNDSKGHVELSIEDSGRGVEESIRPQIFEPFFTTKGRKDGLGMGLSISSSLAKAMGAKLFLEDKSKSKFVLELKPAGVNIVATAV